MQTKHRMLTAVAGGGLAAVLTGCSMNTMIWGPEGAGVISRTDELIAAAASDDTADFACADGVADFGAPADWKGLFAGEPEAFQAHHWRDQAPLDPTWSINVSRTDAPAAGTSIPSDVFYKRVDGELCVVDVAWGTVG